MCVGGRYRKNVTIGLVWIGSSKSKSGGEERRKMSRTEKKGKRRSKKGKGKRSNTPKKTKRKRIQSHFFFQKNFSCHAKERKKKAFVCLFVCFSSP